MHAYDKDMMLKARENFAVMIDYAVSCCGQPLRLFYNRFLGSGIAKLFADGYPKFTLGMSGIELAARVMENTGGTLPMDKPYSFPYEDSSYYWTGLAICQFQWETGLGFASIDRNGLAIEQVHSLFNPLHEADFTKVMEVLRSYYHPQPASLKALRTNLGLTQTELAQKSDVTLRMIRAYEQGTQDLSRAESATLLRLSRALHCPVSRLIEQ